MNLLYVITELGLGGAEILLVNLTNKMVARGHHVEILVLGAINAHAETLDPKIKVHLVQMTKDFTGFLKAYNAFWKLSRQRKWDVVHAHMFHANVISRLARPVFGKTLVVSTAHSNNEGGALRMLAYRLTDFLSDINTNVSRGALARYVSNGFFSLGKSICVYNFVDTKHYRPDAVVRQRMRKQESVEIDHFVILNVGRLVPEKHQMLLLEAFALLLKDHPQVRLFLVGDGPERTFLERRAVELGIRAAVRFCGTQRNTVDWYNLADLFVLTSQVEGFGLVLAEAMASGCPTVATNVGGCAEVVGDVGTLIPPDSKEGLVKAVREHLCMSGEERSLLGQRQRERVVQLFDTDTIEHQWQKIYADARA
jgi:glycosyltransferase involved in cell wall biosynthesis